MHLNDSFFFIRLDVFVNWNQWDKFLLWGKKCLHCITNPSGLLYYSVWLEYTEISCTGGRFVEVSWTMYVCLPVLINIYINKTSESWREYFYDDHVNNLKIIRKKKIHTCNSMSIFYGRNNIHLYLCELLYNISVGCRYMFIFYRFVKIVIMMFMYILNWFLKDFVPLW